MRAALALAFVSGASLAAACGTEEHFQLVRRNAIAARAAASSALASAPAGAATVATGPKAAASTIQTATRTDEASAATVTNPAQECTYYSYPPVTALQAQKVFPPIWEIANLSTAQPEVLALFNALNGSIPKISPRGTPSGNFTGVKYNGTEDPYCWWTWKQCHTPKLAGLPEDIYMVPEPQTWGFSLDDGPNCSHNAFYDFLYEQKQKATLFYIGSNVLDWPLQAQRGLSDGHEVCAHTWSHRYMTSLSNEEVFAEFYYSKKAIKDVLGVTVQCWRPPYGDVDDRVRYIANALGMRTITWLDNTFDYDISTLPRSDIMANYAAIIQKGQNGTFATNGTIVLTHELNSGTMGLMMENYPKIKSAFKNVVPVGVALNNTQPYVEKEFIYPNFAQYVAGTLSVSLVAPTAVSTDASLSLPLSSGASSSISATVMYASTTASGGSAANAQSSGKSAAGRNIESGVLGAVVAAVVGAVGAGAMAVLV
ncbi:chitin deacetylase, carbohydrate esterase family 4 protein [Rhodotorula toruloides]|uniref:chitin deacetylase n=1 Tax=Rhodotorula toruloides TaxID=5286 RepID=A0A511KL09_RHOTO|nr:chitin deacetylase, carbohydrate esterase family 4 protein [Rhodotorula toruloides]